MRDARRVRINAGQHLRATCRTPAGQQVLQTKPDNCCSREKKEKRKTDNRATPVTVFVTRYRVIGYNRDTGVLR
jgi:hypothetical protein